MRDHVKTSRHTHAVFEGGHDLHVFSGHTELVGVDVVGGATLLGLLSVRLHGNSAILPVDRYSNHRGEVSLRAERKYPTNQPAAWHFKLSSLTPLNLILQRTNTACVQISPLHLKLSSPTPHST